MEKTCHVITILLLIEDFLCCIMQLHKIQKLLNLIKIILKNVDQFFVACFFLEGGGVCGCVGGGWGLVVYHSSNVKSYCTH